MNKKLKGTYAQNVSVLLYMHRMYLFKCEINEEKSMLCDSAAIIISLLTIAFKNIQYYCYSITFLKDLLIDI